MERYQHQVEAGRNEADFCSYRGLRVSSRSENEGLKAVTQLGFGISMIFMLLPESQKSLPDIFCVFKIINPSSSYVAILTFPYSIYNHNHRNPSGFVYDAMLRPFIVRHETGIEKSLKAFRDKASNLGNEIFPSLGALTSLRVLDLHKNNFKGYFPAFALENLEILDLYNNY